MKIVILGSTGMLGNAVGRHFIDVYGEDSVYLSYRNPAVAYGKNRFEYLPTLSPDRIPDCDYLINCLGVIKPFIDKNPQHSIFINSYLPWYLAHLGYKVIHITTDCVFSGKNGNYTEDSIHDCYDFYGKTKSLGEPNTCMVVRTSIIGEEIHNNASLIEWAKSQKGKTVNGFTNHLWNGVTTNQYARICQQIIEGNLYQKGLFHVFSNKIDKYSLLGEINKRFNLGLTINKTEASEAIDRTLSTVKDLQSKIVIPTIQEQIDML